MIVLVNMHPFHVHSESKSHSFSLQHMLSFASLFPFKWQSLLQGVATKLHLLCRGSWVMNNLVKSESSLCKISLTFENAVFHFQLYYLFSTRLMNVN